MSFIQKILGMFGGSIPGGEALQQANDLREKVLALKKQIKEGGLKNTLASEGKAYAGDELEGKLTEQAEGLWDEHVGSMVTSKGIPASVVQPVKDKAITEIVGLLREQFDKAVKA